MSRLIISPALLIFTALIVAFGFILLNGYALNLAGAPAHPALMFAMLAAEFVATALAFLRARASITRDGLELAGFLFVVGGTFFYFLSPSLPGLLPPSYSGDPAVHMNFVLSVYESGRIVTGDPGGPSLIAATLAHWLGIFPVYALHLTAAFWLALTAGAVYGAARAILPERAESKVISVFAPFALFAMWDYFAGIVIGQHYFFSQVAGQLAIAALIWFLAEYRRVNATLWLALAAACIVALIVLYQVWLILPSALLGWILLHDWRAGGDPRRRAIIIAGATGASAFALVAAIAQSQPGFIPTFDRFKLTGAVIEPSFGALGGWFLIVPLAGLLLAIRSPSRSQILIPLTLAAGLQTLMLWLAQIGFGAGRYWVNKTFFLWIFPLALLSAFCAARVYEIARQKISLRVAPALALVVASVLIALFVYAFRPPPVFVPISESDIRVALWAREHLDTRQINMLGKKSLLAQWIGIGLWREAYPLDLWIDFPRLGPRTFEEWRDDPAWGDYLFVSSEQNIPADPSLELVYRQDTSFLLAKPRGASPPAAAPIGNFGDTFAMINYELPITSLSAGETLTITARVTPRRVPSDPLVWRVQLRDAAGNAFAEARRLPFENKFPLHRWSPGKLQNETLALPLSPEIRPGWYDLQLGLYRVNTGAALPFINGNGEQDDVLRLGKIKIIQPPVSAHYLGALTPVDARVGDAATLLGFRVSAQSPIRPGDAFRVELDWRAERRAAANYTIFLQLLDARGHLIAQRDAAPRNGNYPTSIWETGEIVVDTHTLVVPPDAESGAHRLIVGMYEFPSLERLPMTGAFSAGDHIELPVVIKIESGK